MMVALAWLIIMTLRLNAAAATYGRATIAEPVVSDEFSMRMVRRPFFFLCLFTYQGFQTNGKKKNWDKLNIRKRKKGECYKCYKCFDGRTKKRYKLNHLIKQSNIDQKFKKR